MRIKPIAMWCTSQCSIMAANPAQTTDFISKHENVSVFSYTWRKKPGEQAAVVNTKSAGPKIQLMLKCEVKQPLAPSSIELTLIGGALEVVVVYFLQED